MGRPHRGPATWSGRKADRLMGMLQDKVVVIAGFGPGLGASLARRARDEGASLVVAARSEDKLVAAAAELGDDACHGLAAMILLGHVSGKEQAVLALVGHRQPYVAQSARGLVDALEHGGRRADAAGIGA